MYIYRQHIISIALTFINTTCLLAQEGGNSHADNRQIIEYSSEKIQQDSLEFREYFKARGEAYYFLADYDKSLKDFNSYLRLEPQDSYTYYNRGVVRTTLGQLQEAVHDFSNAIKFSTDNPSKIYFARGNVYETLKKNSSAISNYTKSISYDPKNVDALNNLGFILNKKKDYRTAIGYLNKALALTPNSVSSLINRAHAFIELGRYPEATADLNRALALSAINLDANNYMGYCLYKQGKKSEACKYFKIAASGGAQPLADAQYCK